MTPRALARASARALRALGASTSASATTLGAMRATRARAGAREGRNARERGAGFRTGASARAWSSVARAAGADGGAVTPVWRFPARAREALGVMYGLSKFRLSAFVASTTACGYALGSSTSVDPIGVVCASAGTMLCSASANTINQIVETVPDSMMRRTAGRPMPSGRCGRGAAWAFAGATAIAGTGLLVVTTNETTAALGAGNIALYAGVYTALKRVHWTNTWVGAVVGAVPPLMGWAAASGGSLDPGAYVLAAALYLWQMPHFMALAYMGKDDYVRGGYRMLSHPMFDKTGRRVAGVAVRNSLALLPLGVVACAMGLTTEPFAYESIALGLPLVATAAAFYASPSIPAARRMFFGSLLYLPAFQTLACFHRIPQDHTADSYETLRRVSVNFPWHCVPFAAGDDWSPERERLKQLRSRALGPALSGTSAAPFPFLPLPIPSCPHERAYAQGGEKDSL